VFAKIFSQIFDSSIADNWKVRHVFEDMLKLADIDGVVDMTHESIAARTRMPTEIIYEAIAELEKPDPRSRTPDANGARLVLIDEHRNWGWIIVNYQKYRDISSEENRREKTRLRARKFRETHSSTRKTNVTHRNACVTHRNADNGGSNAFPSPSASASGDRGAGEGVEHQPRPNSVFGKIKDCEFLIKDYEEKLKGNQLPDKALYPEQWELVFRQRAPIVEELKKVKARLFELRRKNAITD